jgi:hypothetical protein
VIEKHVHDIFAHPAVLAAFSGCSITLFFASLIAIPWLVSRLPQDYFCHQHGHQHGHPHEGRPSLMHLSAGRSLTTARVLKNLLGALLVALGIAMLALPGQGVLTILIGIILLDIPGKRRVIGKIAARPHVAKALNKIRARRGRPPLHFET